MFVIKVGDQYAIKSVLNRQDQVTYTYDIKEASAWATEDFTRQQADDILPAGLDYTIWQRQELNDGSGIASAVTRGRAAGIAGSYNSPVFRKLELFITNADGHYYSKDGWTIKDKATPYDSYNNAFADMVRLYGVGNFNLDMVSRANLRLTITSNAERKKFGFAPIGELVKGPIEFVRENGTDYLLVLKYLGQAEVGIASAAQYIKHVKELLQKDATRK